MENKYMLTCMDWCIDWPVNKYVEINDDNFIGYEIQYRFGPSWWISGINPIEQQKSKGRLTEFGQVNVQELLKFIFWAKNKIVSFDCITSKMNFVDVLKEILNSVVEVSHE